MNHYLTPVSLASRGMLERFYTDVYLGSRGWQTLVGWAGRLGGPNFVRRLSSRNSPDLPASLVTSFPAFGLLYAWRRSRARGWTEQINTHLWAGKRFCESILRRDSGRAGVVYAYSSAALELLRAARDRGQLAVLDHITAPFLAEQRLVAAQHERYPDWAPAWALDEATRRFACRQREECDAADLIVCLSSFARQVLVEEGVPAAKIAVVPPALLGAATIASKPAGDGRRLRVLFAGNDAVRKGLPDLVQAARRLGDRHFEFRAVGVADLTPRGLAETRAAMELCGPVPRPEMAGHFAWADVLAFPTVSETFGIVILEAMRAGAVVVTTPNGGGPDVIRDGVDGFIVPAGDPESLADRLATLAANPRLRREMADSAARRAEEFTGPRYAQQIAELLTRAAASVHAKLPSREPAPPHR